jgi:membrane protease YdiL (CAAX protease family)
VLLFGALAFLVTWLPGLVVRSSTSSGEFEHRPALPGALPVPLPLVLLLLTIVAYGPALAALATAAWIDGRAGVRDLLVQLTRWRVPWWAWVVAVIGPSALALAALAAWSVFTGHPPSRWIRAPSAFLLAGLVFSPWGEELGWRGFAQSTLQRRWSPLASSLVVALIWYGWHQWPVLTPLGQQASALEYIELFVYFVAQSILLGWLYNVTGQSLPIAAAGHSGINLMNAAIAARGVVPNEVITIAFVLAAAVVVLGQTGNLSRWRQG